MREGSLELDALFSDAIKEGDGNCVLHSWKYLLPLFKSSDRKKYSIEVLNMLRQYEYEDRHKNRFVSTHSAPAQYIPADLHQERLNRLCKLSV